MLYVARKVLRQTANYNYYYYLLLTRIEREDTSNSKRFKYVIEMGAPNRNEMEGRDLKLFCL